MQKIEEVIEAAEYTRVRVPMEWLLCIDKAKGLKKSFFLTSDFRELAHSVGVKPMHVDLLLRFLHEMGVCMFIDRPLLRDIVIMDAIAYLVEPATMIICNHSGDENDGTVHELPGVKREMGKRENFDNWTRLRKEGILVKHLLKALWREYASETDRLLSLMTQYGLIVPLLPSEDEEMDEDEDEDEGEKFVVPALLPRCRILSISDVRGEWGDPSRETHSCYFVFTLTKNLKKKTTMLKADIEGDGFCPTGLYERLLGKTISWAQMSSQSCDTSTVYKDIAVLAFGDRFFRLVYLPTMNAMRVDVQGSNPLVVVQKLGELLGQTIVECMQGLKVLVALLYLQEGQTSLDAAQEFEQNSSGGTMLLQLNAVSKGAESGRGVQIDTVNPELQIPDRWVHSE